MLSVLLALFISTSAAADGRKLTDHWALSPYLRPVGGVSLISNGGGTSSALSLGAIGGVRYREAVPKSETLLGVPLFGNLRAQGSYLTSSADISGLEVRVGNFIGPWFDPFGIQTGPDVFWSRYQWGNFVLDPTVGLSWPVIGILRFDWVYFNAGIEPGWYFNPDRPRVDWSTTDALGFGHEFGWFTGVGTNLGGLRLSLSYSRRTTAIGTQQGLGVGLRVGG